MQIIAVAERDKQMRSDNSIHDVFKYFGECRWHDFRDVGIEEDYYDYYYAENCLYVIRDRILEKFFFVKAYSPKQALNSMKALEKEFCQSEGEMNDKM